MDLCYHHGNDAANVLAEVVSGDISTFVDLMNQKLQEIGCTNTHFTNPHGFHDDDHYSTPVDMVNLMKYAMSNEVFREIIETKYVEIKPTNKTETTRKLYNNNYLMQEDDDMYYEYCLGGKTGYTGEARGVLISYAKKGDRLIIVGTFDGSQNINKKQARLLDSIAVYDYIFENYNRNLALKKNDINFEVQDKNLKKIFNISIKDDIYFLGKNNEFSVNYISDINYEKLTTDLNKEEIIGSLEVSIVTDETTIINIYDLYCADIQDYTDDFFKLHPVLSFIIIFMLLVLMLFILMVLISYNIKKKKRYKKLLKKYGHKNVNIKKNY